MAAVLGFAAGSALVLGVMRFRARHSSSLLVHTTFRSKHFCDRVILQQVANGDFQSELAQHEWALLESMGPCFMSLASSMLAGMTLEQALAEQKNRLDPQVYSLLAGRLDVLAQAVREIAESYLARALKKRRALKSTDFRQVPKAVLESCKGKRYRPVKFIARGSAGAIYSAVRVKDDLPQLGSMVSMLKEGAAPAEAEPAMTGRERLLRAVSQQLQRQLVLKRIEPTQKNSAENEYRIASILAEKDINSRCVTYLDRCDESPTELWLLLRRINPSPFGTDLAEYISSQFFQSNSPEYHCHAQQLVLDMLDGLDYISSRGICMRDVKPDNCLIDYTEHLDGHEEMLPRWSDFGLSVDLGQALDGSGLRSPLATLRKNGGNPKLSTETLVEALVGFWYDTQKLVPKPKWKGRRPPEQCFQDPTKVHVSSYDLYMVGIIIVSMALGVDVPHISDEDVRCAFEEAIGVVLPSDYLTSLELGSFLARHEARFLRCFETSFGKTFAPVLLRETRMMLALDPRERPRPGESHARLQAVAGSKPERSI